MRKLAVCFMRFAARAVGRILLVCAFAATLSACGTVNSWMARSMADYVPQWAGGTPSDAPPRPGTPAYDEYRRKLEGGSPQAADREPALAPDRDTRASRAIY
jgi:hypothetical protein